RRQRLPEEDRHRSAREVRRGPRAGRVILGGRYGPGDPPPMIESRVLPASTVERRPSSVADDETIVAISTPPGRGGVGVVRLSGPRAGAVAGEMFRPARSGPAIAAPGQAIYGRFVDSEGQTIDTGYLVLFHGPATFTGEETAEMWAHGSPAALRLLVLAAVGRGARPATPGEFTMRAFLNGRIDATQAEAIRDLIEARTLGDAIERLAGTYERGRRIREGASVALIGSPNAGKSSLFNRLLEEERAIVTPVAGTTRDILEETLDLGGVPVTLLDTAGIREAADEAVSEGVRRARLALETADVRVLVLDGSRPLEEPERGLLA